MISNLLLTQEKKEQIILKKMYKKIVSTGAVKSTNTKNLRAIQLLLGHSKLQSTNEYLGVELENALSISESTEI